MNLSRNAASSSARSSAAASSRVSSVVLLQYDTSHRAAIDHYGLPSDKATGGCSKEHRSTSYLIRFANALQWIVACGLAITHRVLPQRAREVSAHQARCDAVGPHVLRPPLDRDISRKLH